MKTENFRAKLIVFAGLLLASAAIAGIAAVNGREWSLRVYESELRQTLRDFAARDEYGNMERTSLSVLAVSPEYAPQILDETEAYFTVLPQLAHVLEQHFAALTGDDAIAARCRVYYARGEMDAAMAIDANTIGDADVRASVISIQDKAKAALAEL